MTDEPRPPMIDDDADRSAGPAGLSTALAAEKGVETPSTDDRPRTRGQRVRRWLNSLLLPALALFSAFVVGAVIIVVSDETTLQLILRDPLAGLQMGLSNVLDSYGALIRGGIGDPVALVKAIVALDPDAIRAALSPISETILSTTPLVFTGLAVALTFRAGLFNIGGEGQLQLGALAAVFIGFSFHGLPWFIHLPLALIGGMVAGAIWGFIPGILKARTGAHEVITTIMLNFVAIQLVSFSLRSSVFQRPGRTDPISKIIDPSAFLPPLIEGLRAHWGIVLAIAAAVVVSWILFRSTKGFEFRAVGLNPHAARYAGMSIASSIVLSMMIGGSLAGLAGATLVLGTTHTLIPELGAGAGFDGIAIALLGRARPAGVVAAAFLIGALRAGSTPMQVATGTPIYLVVIIQALVIMFIAAPALVRAIYHIRAERMIGSEAFAKGWGA